MTCTLVPINLSSPIDLKDLHDQRLLCGWDNTEDKYAQWREKQDAGLKSFFWITTTTASENEKPQTARAGHVSLDAYTHPPNTSLANAQKTNLTIHSFFILPSYRALGLGSKTMRQLEGLATREPYGSTNCEFITLDCLAKRHYYDPVMGPIAKKIMPICNQEWYERMGYVVFHEEPRYQDTDVDGRVVSWCASFMRKRVGQQ